MSVIEPKTPEGSEIKDQKHSAFLCTLNLREVSPFPLFVFCFFLRLLLFLLYSLFSHFLLIIFFFSSYFHHFSLFMLFTSLYKHPCLFRMHVFVPSFLKLLASFFRSYCTILFRIISSVILSKWFIGFCPCSSILCPSCIQFLPSIYILNVV